MTHSIDLPKLDSISKPPDGQIPIVVIGRMDYSNSSKGIQTVMRELIAYGFFVYEFQGLQERISKALDRQLEYFNPTSTIGKIVSRKSNNKYVKKIIKTWFLMKRPDRMRFLIGKLNPRKTQLAELRSFIGSIQNDKVNLLAHSAGGITAAEMSTDASIERIVCFGYPFKHPSRKDEPYRIRHLRNCKKPYLIIQGTSDEYGFPQQLVRYELKDPVMICPINANHDYNNLTSSDVTCISRRIATFFWGKMPMS